VGNMEEIVNLEFDETQEKFAELRRRRLRR